MGERTRKLVALRTRTDRDLLVLVQRELDVVSTIVGAAISRNSPLFVKAEKALLTAANLLPRISSLSREDRQRFEEKVEKLRLSLAQSPAYAASFPASAAS